MALVGNFDYYGGLGGEVSLLSQSICNGDGKELDQKHSPTR